MGWRQKNEEASSAGRSQGRSVLRLGQFHPGECAHYDRSVDCSLPPGSDERYGEESLGTMKNPDPPEAGFNMPAPFCSSPPNARFGSHESTVLTGVSVANSGLMFNTSFWPPGEVALEDVVGIGVGERRFFLERGKEACGRGGVRGSGNPAHNWEEVSHAASHGFAAPTIGRGKICPMAAHNRPTVGATRGGGGRGEGGF